MGALSIKLGPLFLWQLVVLVVAFGAAGVASLMVTDGFNASTGDAIAAGEQPVPATVGDLINTVSTDGSLAFPLVETAQFESAGQVGEVLVAEGDAVTEGQVLAALGAASVTALEMKVAKARVSLRDAEDALSEMRTPADLLDLAKGSSAIAKARLSVQQAEEELAELVSGPAADVIEEGQAAIDAAIPEMKNAEANLALVVHDQDGKLETAQNRIDAAADAYAERFAFWLGTSMISVDAANAPTAQLAAWGADLDVLFDPGTDEPVNLALRPTPPSDDPATAWNESTIYSWTTFYPGQVVGTCVDGAPFQGSCVSLELDDDWSALEAAREGLAPVELSAAKAVLAAETAVAREQERLDSAREALEELSVESDPILISAAEADLAVAEQSLAEAKGAQTELTAEPDLRDLELLQTQIDAAELALTEAVAELAGVTLKAPIAGLVTEVDMETGRTTSGQQAGGVTIVDRTIVELEGTVDEIDVLSILVGDATSITMTALAGQTLQGTVTEIGAPTNQQGVVTFPVSIRVEVPDGLELLEGLSATASVVISELLDVLRVPTAAIQGSFVQPFVRVVSGAVVEERSVELGASDDFWVVVIAGLAEGEMVAMPAPSSGQAGFGNFARGGFGGVDIQVLRALQGGGGGGRSQRGGGQGAGN